MTERDPIDIVRALRDGKVIQFDESSGARIRDPRPTADPGDSTPPAFAFDESGEWWLCVEHPDDPAFEDDLAVEFNNLFVHGTDGDAKIDAAAEFVESLPGVESVERQDEDIFIRGTRDAQRIRDSVVAWWSADRAHDCR